MAEKNCPTIKIHMDVDEVFEKVDALKKKFAELREEADLLNETLDRRCGQINLTSSLSR